MKPAAFDYIRATTMEEALAAKSAHGEAARFLAGGQSLVPAMNFRMAMPAVLIDLNRVAALDRLDYAADGTLQIGAMVRYRRLQRDPAVAARHPIIAEALAEVAHPQIRNRGTLGGNLAHADPASEMPAVMLALGARMRLCSGRGERWVAAADFFTGILSTALAEDEMLAEIAIPPLPPRTGTCFLELARRRGDYAMAGVAAVVTLDAAGNCAAASIACCNAGVVPMAAPRAAAALVGRPIGELAPAIALLREEIDPQGGLQASADYQRHLAGVLAERALRRAAQRAMEQA
jgi:carbon-monoxide dehydrogenase medium subunit